MTNVHRRVLGPKEARCHPVPECPRQHDCARFLNPLPQGIGASLGNFRHQLIAGQLGYFCSSYLSGHVTDDELEAKSVKKVVKPPL